MDEIRHIPASPRGRNQEPAACEADLIRAASTHLTRLAEELRRRGGVTAAVLDYLSHHPERRFRYLRAIRGYGIVSGRGVTAGGATAEKTEQAAATPIETPD